MANRVPKELRRIVAAATAAGWTVQRLASGHWRFVPPDRTKKMVVTGGTPSDHRVLRNLVADLRRQGLALP